jgi:phospholipase C
MKRSMALLTLAIALPAAAQELPRTVPAFSHVVVVVLENKEFGDVVGNRRMPVFNRWAKEHTLLAAYHAVTHPSLPNYLALIGGDTFGVHSDCTDCYVAAKSLADLLEGSGRTWRAYLEGLAVAGFTGDFAGRYAKKHNPFVYFETVRGDPARLSRSVLPLDQLAADLAAGVLPDFAFIMPDMCDSSHDCGLEVTDAWLGRTIGPVLASQVFDRTSLLVVTFDEGTSDKGCCGSGPKAGGGHIATLLVSGLAQAGFRDPTPYSHYSLLKTILASWGLGELGRTSDPAVGLILRPWR